VICFFGFATPARYRDGRSAASQDGCGASKRAHKRSGNPGFRQRRIL